MRVTTPNYKPSRYNYFLEKDGKILGYNFLYRTIISLPREGAGFAELLTCSEEMDQPSVQDRVRALPDGWLGSLAETGFLVEESLDELSILRFKYHRNLFDSKLLSLVLLPTLWCNVNCPYCFELKRPVFMKPDVQDAIVRWLEERFRDKRQVHVAWFGGEPLLAKETIFELTDRLQRFCADIGATYGSSLTTNGVLLDSEFQKRLGDLKIQNVQVTFDGDREDHDKLRSKRNGQGTFDQIFSNVVAFSEAGAPTRLSIRVNVADANYARIEQLLQRFPSSVREETTIFFRWIWANEATGYREFARDKQGAEPFRGLAELYAMAQRLGWRTRNPHNDLTDGYCEVDYFDHYSIAPDGNVFLCTHTFDPKEALGSLLAPESLSSKDALSERATWYAASPWSDDACVSCKLLPICWGGCRKSRVAGGRPCIEEKKSLDLYVLSTVAEQLAAARVPS